MKEFLQCCFYGAAIGRMLGQAMRERKQAQAQQAYRVPPIIPPPLPVTRAGVYGSNVKPGPGNKRSQNC
jgi:hypothetical protein